MEEESEEMKQWRAKVERETSWVESGWMKRVIKSARPAINLLVVLLLAAAGMEFTRRLFGPVVGFIVFMTVFGIYAFGGKSKSKR